MKFSLRNYYRLITIILLGLVYWWAPGTTFAQNSPPDKTGLSKEELKIEMKPLLRQEDKLSGGRQELRLLPKNILPQKSSAITQSDKETTEKSSINFDNKIFTTEVGLVDAGQGLQGPRNLLSLDDCLQIAVKNNIPLQIAAKSVTLAKWRLWENRRNMLPTATITYEQYNGTIFGRKYMGRKQYIEGEQPVFHGGELYFTMKQAETNLEVVKNDYDRINNDLVLQVKKAYYSFERAGANLKIQESLASEVSRVYDMINRQYEANVTTKIEFFNVSSQASQVKYQLASAEGDVSMAELILKQAMNMETNEKIDIEPSPEFKKVDINFDKLLQIAFVSRPEMKINSLLMEYYNYGKKIAVAKGWIKVDLDGMWGLAKERYRPQDLDQAYPYLDIEADLSQQWYAGVKASIPFWGSTAEYQLTKEQWTPVVSAYQGTEATTQSMKLKILDKLGYYSDKATADIEFDKQRQELTKIKQDITMDLKESCFNYAKAIIQLETATNKVQYQEKDLELAKLKRGMDEAQDSNVVESMIKLAQEKFGYLQALADCHISLASVDKAIGIKDYCDNGYTIHGAVLKEITPRPAVKTRWPSWFGWKK